MLNQQMYITISTELAKAKLLMQRNFNMDFQSFSKFVKGFVQEVKK